MNYQKIIGTCLLSLVLVGCQPQLRNYIKPIQLNEADIALVTAHGELTWGSGEIHLQDGVKQLSFVVREWQPNQQEWQEARIPVELHPHDKEIRRFAVVYDALQKQLRLTLESSETVSYTLDMDAEKQLISQKLAVPEQINYELDTLIPVAVIGATDVAEGQLDLAQLDTLSLETFVQANPKATYYVAGLVLSE